MGVGIRSETDGDETGEGGVPGCFVAGKEKGGLWGRENEDFTKRDVTKETHPTRKRYTENAEMS